MGLKSHPPSLWPRGTLAWFTGIRTEWELLILFSISFPCRSFIRLKAGPPPRQLPWQRQKTIPAHSPLSPRWLPGNRHTNPGKHPGKRASILEDVDKLQDLFPHQDSWTVNLLKQKKHGGLFTSFLRQQRSSFETQGGKQNTKRVCNTDGRRQVWPLFCCWACLSL